jgi:GTP-binding protein
MGFDSEDALACSRNKVIESAFQKADLFIFLVDVRMGLLEGDMAVAQKIRESGKPVLLLCNKADTAKLEAQIHDFWQLGLGEPRPYSVNEKKGLAGLKEELMRLTERVEGSFLSTLPKIALVGKRNSGKSTLLNLLSRQERVIVSDLPGTTKDYVSARIDHYGKSFLAIDTAGLKHDNWEDTVDFFSIKRTERMLRDSDAIIFLLDAERKISAVDKKLSSLLRHQAKPVVIAVNKWDALPEKIKGEQFLEYLEKELSGLFFAPVVFISALQEENIRPLIRTLFDILDQARLRISTGELNRVLEKALAKKSPPRRGGQQAKFLFVSQVSVQPPTFVFKVNESFLVDKNYRRYLENSFREAFNMQEIPLKFIFKSREKKD